jgi:hypothetical protein
LQKLSTLAYIQFFLGDVFRDAQLLELEAGDFLEGSFGLLRLCDNKTSISLT